MADLDDELARLWASHRGEIAARVATIEAAVGPLSDNTLDEASRTAAAKAAHHLAGTAGTFGFPEASACATAVERRFTQPRGHHGGPALAPLVADLRSALQGPGDMIERSRQ
jgi:HPt (histidine-containing phosphotransfer) domain-containing protein